MEEVIRIRRRMTVERLLKLTRLTASFQSKITLIFRQGEEVNAKSIVGLMNMRLAPGSQISLRAEGEDEVRAMEALRSFFDGQT